MRSELSKISAIQNFGNGSNLKTYGQIVSRSKFFEFEHVIITYFKSIATVFSHPPIFSTKKKINEE